MKTESERKMKRKQKKKTKGKKKRPRRQPKPVALLPLQPRLRERLFRRNLKSTLESKRRTSECPSGLDDLGGL